MKYCTTRISSMKIILTFSIVIAGYCTCAQGVSTKNDSARYRSTTPVWRLQPKVPNVLLSPLQVDSLATLGVSTNFCDRPHGILIIDDQEVPCDSISNLKPDNIVDIRILSIPETHALYGDKGDPYGALVLITKKYKRDTKNDKENIRQKQKP